MKNGKTNLTINTNSTPETKISSPVKKPKTPLALNIKSKIDQIDKNLFSVLNLYLDKSIKVVGNSSGEKKRKARCLRKVN